MVELFDITIDVVRVCILSWFFVDFPTRRFIEYLPFDIIKNVDLREILRFVITQPFKCYKCMAFWLGWILFGIWIGLISSLFMYILEKKEII